MFEWLNVSDVFTECSNTQKMEIHHNPPHQFISLCGLLLVTQPAGLPLIDKLK